MTFITEILIRTKQPGQKIRNEGKKCPENLPKKALIVLTLAIKICIGLVTI